MAPRTAAFTWRWCGNSCHRTMHANCGRNSIAIRSDTAGKWRVGEQGRKRINGRNLRIRKGGFNMLTTQNLLDSLDRWEREDYSLQLFGVCPKCPEPDPIKEESQSGRGRIP